MSPSDPAADPRLDALTDLAVPEARDGAGLHRYDGAVQDLSPDGVRAGLARLGGPQRPDPHDERHVAAFEARARLVLGELGMHRRDPGLHVEALDVSGYDREYAPLEERAAARGRHLAAWPDAVDAAVEALDAVSAPVAQALLGAARGLGEDVEDPAALAALDRFLAHLERAAREGDPDPSLGARALTRLLALPEGLGEQDADLGRLAAAADAERDRLHGLLAEACDRIAPGERPQDVVPRLLADHPDASGVLREARAQVDEVLAFAREHDLAPHLDGECRVGPAPASKRWSMAMMAWAAPQEPDGPSWYWVTPPDPSWPAQDVEDWLSVFSRTTLPAVTAHEVAPGHFAHGRSLRRAATPERRVLQSMAFAEGWAHYTEEVMVEQGFRGDDPRFAAGVWLEALVRVTRMACAVGLHTGAMTVEDATRRFEQDALMARASAASEARRGTFDPTYGRYTWGKLALLRLREEARAAWGPGFSLPRFHRALLALGSPPLGLLPTALERG
ncbi:DUF885 family protein [Vallicoccus soli]|uniref:DUF885 family protein n=1 Tax=Vallicoccus soli TaxID=2339232 RepID=A0A3A3Z2G6_9ACTN|nr:DUF885 family protein [Vallicoccus soli]RJK98460.1 DUF885 family protein [Vallicoccus soli]